MKEFFRTKSFKMLIVSVCILFAVIIYTASIGGFASITGSVIGGVTTPLQDITAAGTNEINESLEDYTQNSVDYIQTITDMQKEIDTLREQLIEYQDIKRENDQLHEYLDIKDENKDWDFIPANIIAKDPNDLFYGFIINKGSLSGIELGDPVITSSGVVGKITSIGATYCYVTTILSPNLQIGCTSVESKENGVLNTNIELADNGFCKLSYLDPKSTVQKGELVKTSGLGGVFPENLIVGTVTKVQKENSDISLYATVKPAVDIKKIKEVMVITSFNGQGEAMEDIIK